MAESLVVETRVRSTITSIKGADTFRLSGDALDVLNKRVEGLIEDAVKRAKENGRVTVQKQDF
jgi:histone H3/H4